MKTSSRRKFLKKAGLVSAGLFGPKELLSNANQKIYILQRKYHSENMETIRYGLIGAGNMGLSNIQAALRHNNTQLTAVCDLYEGRLNAVKNKFGSDVFLTKKHEELLNRRDVDIVIIATSDHWHMQIGIDALKAGKHVYCEKPVVHSIKEGKKLIDAWNKFGKKFMVGSQGMSSPGNEKAKELLAKGAIGELNYAEAIYARSSSSGAWQYRIPEDGNQSTVDWKRYISNTTKREFDPLRFFRWRNYLDYGTGMSGDLFVHLFTSLHFVVDSLGPNTISSLGGLRYWKDGREVPDVMLGIFNYPSTSQHPGFNLSLYSNFADPTTESNILRLVGTKGSMDVGWETVRLKQHKGPVESITLEERKKMELMGHTTPRKKMLPPNESLFKVDKDYKGVLYDHHGTLIYAIKTDSLVVQDPIFGFRAAAPALLCNDSYHNKKMIQWDPENLKVF